MSKAITDFETALTKHYLNDSSVNESETCGINLYPHAYKNCLAKCVFGVFFIKPPNIWRAIQDVGMFKTSLG